MTNNPIPQVKDLSGPLLLLAHLNATLAHLPAADFHVSPVYPDRLEVSVHGDQAAFDAWRQALALPVPGGRHRDGLCWLVTHGPVRDTEVQLTGFQHPDAHLAVLPAAWKAEVAA